MATLALNPDGIWSHPSFSQVAMGTGTIICFSGMLANDEQGNIIGEDLRTQVITCMRKLEIALRAAGVGWEDVVRRTIYVANMEHRGVIPEAIAEVTGPVEAQPAQTLIGGIFARPDVLVEIELTAVRPL